MTADLTPTEVAALRERANAATPGEWYDVDPLAAALVNRPNAAHIAGLDPATVLALIDAVADAWDQGFDKGQQYDAPRPDLKPLLNPYRQEDTQ